MVGLTPRARLQQYSTPALQTNLSKQRQSLSLISQSFLGPIIFLQDAVVQSIFPLCQSGL